ncbi:MAG: hypothetical protein QE280_15280 [Caulobacter sp.]|nr:hypothetical protein [Caulobacter sp.]
MNTLLAGSLLSAALGLSLGCAPWRILMIAAGFWAAIILCAGYSSVPATWSSILASAAFASVILNAATSYLPKGPGPYLSLGMAANAGLWTGALLAAGGRQDLLALVAPWIFLALPAGWLIRKGARIAVQVAASWLIAVAVLAVALPLVSVPAYQSDHME